MIVLTCCIRSLVMADNSRRESEPKPVTPPKFDWAVVNSLLQAQTHTSASLERYLLYVTHDDFEIPTEQVDECLEQAITSQKRALEDLEAAQRFLQQHNAD